MGKMATPSRECFVFPKTKRLSTASVSTTLARPIIEPGRLSGKPLKALSNQILAHIARNASENLILIGVGGIFTGDDLYQKIALGAHLCQVYTGWVYGGPDMVPTVLEQCVELME